MSNQLCLSVFIVTLIDNISMDNKNIYSNETNSFLRWYLDPTRILKNRGSNDNDKVAYTYIQCAAFQTTGKIYDVALLVVVL